MNDAARRALRTFLQVFVGVFAISLLGFLDQVREWASCTGEACEFPDVSVLGKAAIAAVSAAAASLVTWLQNLLEDAGTIKSYLKAKASSGADPATVDPAR